MSSVFVGGGGGAGSSFLSQLVKNNVVKQSTVTRISLFIVLNLALKVVKVFGL
jgi:preprotein translocase subunit SecG